MDLVEPRLGAGTFPYTLKSVMSTMYCLPKPGCEVFLYAGFGIWKWRQRIESNFKTSLEHKSETLS